MESIRDVLAKNLREHRAKLGYTQAELAEKAGISTSYMTRIEIKQQFPTPEILDKLAEALEITPSELFYTSISPIAAIEQVENRLLANLERVIDEAVQRAIAKNLSTSADKQR